MAKVYFKGFDSNATLADCEQMAGLLQEANFTIITNQEDADIIIINSCTTNEKNLFADLEELKNSYKIVIISGCIAQSNSNTLKEYPLIGIYQINKVIEVVEEALNDNIIQAIATDEIPQLNTCILRTNKIKEIIPISRGQKNKCSFCNTKSPKEKIVSYTIEDIVKRVTKALQEGVQEIILTSQDNGCYGVDIGTNLVTLLETLTTVQGEFKIQVGMMKLDYVSKILNQLIEIFKNPKIFRYLHISLQSGNNTVLKNLKNEYTAEQYLEQIYAFKKEFPHITIATDVKVGFVEENNDQFFDTITLIRNMSPNEIYISKKENITESEKKSLPDDEILRRVTVLSEISNNIKRLQNEKWYNWSGEIMIDEKGTQENQWIGKNNYYKPIILEGQFTLGEIVHVKISKTDQFGLYAKQTKIQNQTIIIK